MSKERVHGQKCLSRRDALRSGVLMATLPLMGVVPAFATEPQAPSRPAQREYPRPTGATGPPYATWRTTDGRRVSGERKHKTTGAPISARLAPGPLPADVVEKTKWHILDSFAAIVSGTQLPAGRVATGVRPRLCRRQPRGLNGDRRDCAAWPNGSGDAEWHHRARRRRPTTPSWGLGIRGSASFPPHSRSANTCGSAASISFAPRRLATMSGTRIQLAAGTTIDFLGPTNSLGGVFGATAAAACVARAQRAGSPLGDVLCGAAILRPRFVPS